MPRRDAVGALHLLRRIETMTARRSLAKAQERADLIRAASIRLLGALGVEARTAPAADFAAWLPAARALLAAASTDCQAAEAVVRQALESVTAARRAERGVADEVERRARADRAERLVKEQKLLEDAARVTVESGQE
jgi:hypothetical protein